MNSLWRPCVGARNLRTITIVCRAKPILHIEALFSFSLLARSYTKPALSPRYSRQNQSNAGQDKRTWKIQQPPGIFEIILPQTRKGVKAAKKAKEFWTERWDENRHMRKPTEDLPLKLLVDRREPQYLNNTTHIFCDRIIFSPNDDLGKELWRVANPTLWSERPRWVRWYVYAVAFATFGMVCFWCSHQEQVPITGRWRFNFYPTTTIETKLLRALALREMEKEHNALPGDSPEVRWATEVLQTLIPSSGLEHLEWRVRVLDTPDVINATVSTGGMVIIYSGLLPVCGDSAGLATVLSHEIAHVVAGHDAEAKSAIEFFTLASVPVWPFLAPVVIGIIFEDLFFIYASCSLVLLGAASFFLGKCESEADYIGLMIMAKSEYNIHEAVRFWERLEVARKEALEMKISKGELEPELLSLHPHNATRIKQIEKWIPEILQKTGMPSLQKGQ